MGRRGDPAWRRRELRSEGAVLTALRFVGAAASILLFSTALSTCARTPVAPLKLKGVWHEVQKGDTVRKVAEKYGVDPAVVAELNDLSGDGELASRKEVFVPTEDGAPPGTGAPPPPPLVAAGDGEKQSRSAKGSCGEGERPCFAWPVKGKVTSLFGTRGGAHHDGIDISAATGTPVTAAEDGKTLYSGDDIKGYGNMIIVRHDGQLLTVYAHNDENLIVEGDQVKRGQVIAKVGSTGSATGPHLHFEVRKEEQPVDPMLYLPSEEDR